jgi:hypothetical protein
MYGGRSPISVGWAVSRKAALTVSDVGRMFCSCDLSCAAGGCAALNDDLVLAFLERHE